MPNPFGPGGLQQQPQNQMRQMRERQMEGAYWQQQQTKKAERDAQMRQNAERFRQAQQRAEDLRRQHDAGQMSDADYRQALQNLALQDPSGQWWSLGVKTGDWHRYDGSNWVRQSPSFLTGPPMPASGNQPSPAFQEHHPIRAFFRFVFTFVFIAALGFGVAILLETGVPAIAGLALGALAAVISARRAFRGD